MSQPPLDEQGEAHEALNSAVESYGKRVLSSPQILGNLVTDLLPDLPRERSLLVAAAEADVASELSQHVEGQHVDADTAVQLVARALCERKSIDAAASLWVTTEYARALGYPARPYQPGSAPQEAQAFAADLPGAATVPPPQPAGFTPTEVPAQGPQGPAYQPPAQAPPFGGPTTTPPQQPQFQHMETEVAAHGPGGAGYGDTGGGAGYGGAAYGGGYGGAGGVGGGWQAPGGQAMAPPGGTGQGPPRGRRGGLGGRPGLIAALTVAALVVVYLVIAAAAQVFPFAKSGSHHAQSTTSPPSPTPSPTPSTTALAALPSGIASLTQLLPGDLDQKATECSPQQPPFHWAMPGLVQATTCTDPGLPGGQVYAYQVNSAANFQTTWQNFNQWWGFNLSSAGTNCPPVGSDGQGTVGWHNNYFPSTDGQSLECEFVGTNNDEPAYAWAFPTDYAFIVAQGAAGSSFSALDSWWTHGATQTTSPTPAP